MQPHGITLLAIRKAVCDYYGITVDQMLEKTRLARIAWPRHVGLHFARQLTGLSLMEIASTFNIKEHSAVLYALKKVKESAECYSSVRRDLELIEKQIKERTYCTL